MYACRMTHRASVSSLLRMLPLLAVLLGACSSQRSSPPASKPTPTAPTTTKVPVKPIVRPEPPEQGRWDCNKDTDCQNSCRYGAVSKAWYTAHQSLIAECQDGCNNQISAPPKCIDKQCAAFDSRNGKPRPFCTKRKVTR